MTEYISWDVIWHPPELDEWVESIIKHAYMLRSLFARKDTGPDRRDLWGWHLFRQTKDAYLLFDGEVYER